MNSLAQLAKTLQQQLVELASRASLVDKHTPSWQQRHWFDTTLFRTHSNQLLDYVQESSQLLARLQQSLKQSQQAAHLLEHQQWQASQLAAQVSALSQAFANVDIRRQEQPTARRYKTETSPASAKTAVAGRLLAELGGNSAAVYQKLNEYHQFEQRLLEMIEQAKRHHQSSEQQLALHARLGRCRQAISAVEAEILWLEQKK